MQTKNMLLYKKCSEKPDPVLGKTSIGFKVQLDET